ncbi:hypothetical protein [Flavobacterium sp. MEB061]|uniref:hypothetical protein n=1 Tax=Flavobacterium sp. MEB061 TaxID=1587524 RepID=UPI000AA67407|nr:hypothetical protein [Flavobacterium sp. MEB061]
MTIVEASTLIISLIAIILSIRSNYISKKSYDLSKKDFENKQSSFSIYLNDNYTIKLQDKKYVLIHLSIINKSDSKNSFNAKLRIDCILKNDEKSTLYFDHLPDKKEKLKKSDFTFFERDINLNEKETTTKWLIFETPLSLYQENEIEKYIIKIEDQKNKTKEVNTLLFKELINENKAR